MQRVLLVPNRRRLRRQKVDQHRPLNLPGSIHIAHILMVASRPDPISYVQCEKKRETPPMGRSAWPDHPPSVILHFCVFIVLFIQFCVTEGFRKCHVRTDAVWGRRENTMFLHFQFIVILLFY